MEWSNGSNGGEIMKLQGISKVSPAFYEPPQRKTSAEIINEARVAIRESQMTDKNFAPPSIKPLQTQRPFTPRDKERLLFGNKVTSNRPPSSFSLRYLQNETDLPTTPPDSTNLLTPNLITSRTLIPPPRNHQNKFHHQRSNSVSEINDQIFNIAVKDQLHKIKLPSLDTCRPLQKRKVFKNTSLDNLPEENESDGQKGEGRKAFSSPQERTEFNDPDNPFGKASLQRKNLSQCLLLGPQNLEKIFDNKHIIENSQTLFLNTGYFTSQLHNSNDLKVNDKKERTFEDVLLELNSESEKKCGEDRIVKLLGELYDCMEKENMINQKVASNLKIRILKCLYRFVESQNEQILICIAKIILSIKVTGNNLSGVCKLIFKVAKIDKNDYLFFQKNLLELFLDALGRSSPLDDAEACVYGYGAVKFLTMNQKLLEKILNLGILQLMVLHMKIINVAKTEKSIMPDQTNHALYQLTGALRNLVSEENIYESFVECGTIPQLCQTLEIFSSDLDIVANISRTLSIISTNECCCDAIIEYKNIYKLLINLFEKYPGNEEIIVRLTYTLGNIVSKIDNTRVQYFYEENSIESLITLWKIYLERTLKNCSLKLEASDGLSSNSEDVMIKIIRVVANMVINPEIGKRLNEKYGNTLIEEILKVLISNPFKKNEELVLSILSTLNNLSYYYTSDVEVDIFHVKQVNIVEGITEYAKSENKECVIETMRILGNLSRSKVTRNYICETNVFEILIDLLETVDHSQLKTTVGVFVNLMSDNRSRILFKNNGGVSKIIKILTTECDHDWSLGNLVCQVLWNYCIDTIDLHELFSESEIHKLLVLLADYLDEEKIFGIEEHMEDMDVYVTQEYLIWEEFANVATNLLEKIEYFLDTFDQITIDDKPTENNLKTKDSSTNISLSAW
ncbi:armadillo repeat-containing protein 2 [Diabrotica virgifera virgifera]|uniref:Armadillo repeat-containing protein 2 n=1 Tax=Diabrotica virgifera virgifera TaxID=50390 RepID=A0ABM5IJ04_DIAVI|nr:armadillo repeat-containing protein 2 [Diabrotica virgifera virgifera]